MQSVTQARGRTSHREGSQYLNITYKYSSVRGSLKGGVSVFFLYLAPPPYIKYTVQCTIVMQVVQYCTGRVNW